MLGLMARILKQLGNDRRLLALMILGPLLMLTLIYFIMGPSSYRPSVGAALLPAQMAALGKQEVRVVPLDMDGMDADLAARRIDAAVWLEGGSLHLKFLENDIFRAGTVTKAVQGMAREMQRSFLAANPGLRLPTGEVSVEYLHGKASPALFDSMGYIMLGFISFFFSFILSGIAFIRERSQGTLERFILAPIPRWKVVAGYTLAYGLVSVAQSTLILAYAAYVLGMAIGGAFGWALLVMLLMSFTAVSVGILVSEASHNEFEVVQFIPILIIPQLFFSGLIPPDMMPYRLGVLSNVMPLWYAGEALKKVIVYRWGLGAIWMDVAVLVLIIAVLSFLNVRVLRHFRKI